MDSEKVKAHFIKIGRERGQTNQEALGLESDEFFRQLNSHSPSAGEWTQEQAEQRVTEYWDAKFPI
jgi:hypothetical protein